MKAKIRNSFRWIVEIMALVFFIGLTVNHKLQLWFALFLSGVILSLFAGRYYCGWICPMNTLFRPIHWIYKKLKLKRLPAPKILSSPWVRYILLILFLSAMAAIRIFHIQLNLLLYITLFSVVVTLFFEEAFWHRHLCPFGTILSLTSRGSRISMKIEEAGCISCGACQKRCPSGSIVTKEDGKRYNRKYECLVCHQCVDVCPTKVCKIG